LKNDLDQRKTLSQIQAASDVWSQIENESQPADRWIGNYFYLNRKRFGSRDRRFISQVIYNLFRHKTYLGLWASYLGRANVHRDFLVILAAFLDGLVELPEAKELSSAFLEDPKRIDMISKIRTFEFPPDVLYETREEYLAIRYSYPLWMIKRWSGAWGVEKTENILRTFESRPHLIVRVNPLKTTREKLIRRLRDKGFEVEASINTPWSIVFKERQAVFELEEFHEGFFEVQDTGSQLACFAVNPKPGEMIWDVCAGGGGKSLLLAAMMENKGRLVATDIRPKKLLELKKRAKRAGVFNIFPADISRMAEIRGARSGFDKILVDAPCSGTGTLRRNPDAKWKMTEDRFQSHHDDQIAILKSVIPHLKKGGQLIYVTCSLEMLEDEDVMKKIEREEGENLKLVPSADCSLGQQGPHGMRLWPGDENDGFFIGAAEKI